MNNKQVKILNSKGFTLIELLVVAGLLVVISGIVMGTLLTSLRSGIKAKITNQVSQNGNYALSAITRDVVSSYNVLFVDGHNTCMDTSTNPSTSWGQASEIVLEQADKSTITYTCDNTNPAETNIRKTINPADTTLPPEETYLLDSNVKYSSCSFVCFQPVDEFSSPIIKVSFTLTQIGTGLGAESIANASFSTSATLRNFKSF